MTVRPEAPGDAGAVRRVHEAAFGRPDEADLVDRLRDDISYLALVALDADEVVGHIAFTAVTADPPRPELSLVGLAPMAVAPERQRAGVGTALVRAGLTACRHAGHDAVVVLGHPAYYPRFGFAPRPGLTDPYGAPTEAFMALELRPRALHDVRATVRYAPAFDA